MSNQINGWECRACHEYNAPSRSYCRCGLYHLQIRPGKTLYEIFNNGQTPHANAQPDIGHEPLATPEAKEANPSRVRVSIKAFRAHDADADALVPKWFIDCLRYAGIIKNDTRRDIILEVEECLCSKQDERTEIEVTPIL